METLTGMARIEPIFISAHSCQVLPLVRITLSLRVTGICVVYVDHVHRVILLNKWSYKEANDIYVGL